MNIKKNKYLITSALPYANGVIHVGHVAGVYLPSDLFRRFLGLFGADVVSVCGSDEYGAEVAFRATIEKVSPKQVVDKYHNINAKVLDKLGIHYDNYSRTTNNTHTHTVHAFYDAVSKSGDLSEIYSEQYFDEVYKQFIPDSFVIGVCNNCGAETNVDYCNKCDNFLGVQDVSNVVSKLSNAKPILKKTKHLYFNLNNYTNDIKKWLIKTNFRKYTKMQSLGMLGNMEQKSITRDLAWGVTVPKTGFENKVFYVWFDAPIGYISFTKEIINNWQDYWTNALIYNFIGKDNIVFHTIIFPSMILSHNKNADVKINLPHKVVANHHVLVNGEKISKSKGNGINMVDFFDMFKNFENAVDAIRYYCTKNAPETKDFNFSISDFIDTYNKDLCNNLGNFVNRVLTLSHKYTDGIVPEITNSTYLESVDNVLNKITNQMLNCEFKASITLFIELSNLGNKYLQETEIWKMENHKNRFQVIGECLQTVCIICILSKIFLPDTYSKLCKTLNVDFESFIFENITTKLKLFTHKHKINKPSILFLKLDKFNYDNNNLIVGKL